LATAGFSVLLVHPVRFRFVPDTGRGAAVAFTHRLGDKVPVALVQIPHPLLALPVQLPHPLRFTNVAGLDLHFLRVLRGVPEGVIDLVTRAHKHRRSHAIESSPQLFVQAHRLGKPVRMKPAHGSAVLLINLDLAGLLSLKVPPVPAHAITVLLSPQIAGVCVKVYEIGASPILEIVAGHSYRDVLIFEIFKRPEVR